MVENTLFVKKGKSKKSIGISTALPTSKQAPISIINIIKGLIIFLSINYLISLNYNKKKELKRLKYMKGLQ